jgi:hypothetical protein
MAKSKLTPDQWLEIDIRLQAGESGMTICKEYGITEGAIRHHFGPLKKDKVERVAAKIVEARRARDELPPMLQIKADSLADRMHAMSMVMAQSAELSAKTAMRLASLANTQAQKLDDADPDANTVRAVHALTDTSNKASWQPMELLKVAKTAQAQEPDDDEPGIDASSMSTEALAEVMAAKDRARLK